MTGAEIVLEALRREGVEIIFGYLGGANLPIYQQLPRYPELRHVLVEPLSGRLPDLRRKLPDGDAQVAEHLDGVGDALRQRHPAAVLDRLRAQVLRLLDEPRREHGEDGLPDATGADCATSGRTGR